MAVMRIHARPHPNPSMRLALSSTMVVIRLSCKSRSRGCRVHKPGGSVGCVGLRARSTFYPCRHVGRTPYASCAVERVAANPLHTSAPSLNDGECLTHPVRERAPGPVVYVVNSLSVAAVSLRCWRLRLRAFQLCALRQHSVLDVAPQCDQQSARQGHDADAPHALAPCRKASVEPFTECAVWLIAQPVPGDLHQQGAYAPVAKAAPAKQLAGEQPGAGQANRAQLEQGQQRPLAQGLQLRLAALLQCTHLLPHQLLAHALALDLGPQPRRHLPLELLQALSPPAPAHLLQAYVVQHRQRADAIHVGVAFALQAPQLSVQAPLVFLLHTGHAYHPPHALLPARIAHQHLVELGHIQRITLGPPRTPVDLDARGVHYHVLDALLAQPAMQPEPVASGLVAAQHTHCALQPAALLSLLNKLQQRAAIPGCYRMSAE